MSATASSIASHSDPQTPRTQSCEECAYAGLGTRQDGWEEGRKAIAQVGAYLTP